MSKLNLWRQEHGEDYLVPEEALEAVGLIDRSWHNDISPSFGFGSDIDPNDQLSFWVDHPDVMQREAGGGRFMVMWQENGGGTEPSEIFFTDDLKAALAKLVEWKARLHTRFVWLIGAIREVFPDVPEPVAGQLVLWDRQEKKSVVVVFETYAQAICLEKTDGIGGAPFTSLALWFNRLDNVALASEGLPISRPEASVTDGSSKALGTA